jgi:hypothetical protein
LILDFGFWISDLQVAGSDFSVSAALAPLCGFPKIPDL